jgi:hypothetical protein
MGIKSTKASDVLWIPRRMHRSPAFHKLTKKAVTVLLEFFFLRKMAEISRKKGDKQWVISNNGEIIFTYDEAFKKFGMARSTFRSCLDQLVEFGFINIPHPGGGLMQDCSKYEISDRWEKYGKEKFINKSRKKDTRGLGFTKKNWETKTGRKRKSQPKISISRDTSQDKSIISNDTCDQEIPVSPSMTHATLKTDPNYYIQKGLEVFETMYPTQYH